MLVYNPLLFQNKVMKKCGGKVLAIINIIVVARFFFFGVILLIIILRFRKVKHLAQVCTVKYGQSSPEEPGVLSSGPVLWDIF